MAVLDHVLARSTQWVGLLPPRILCGFCPQRFLTGGKGALRAGHRDPHPETPSYLEGESTQLVSSYQSPTLAETGVPPLHYVSVGGCSRGHRLLPCVSRCGIWRTVVLWSPPRAFRALPGDAATPSRCITYHPSSSLSGAQ